MLFSGLVDADLLATEAWDKGRMREKVAIQIEVLADTLERHLQDKRSQGDDLKGQAAILAGMRAEVSDACYSAAQMPPGAFRLTVPTGGGKTLSGLRFALHHAHLHRLERIIVVIPYTSILQRSCLQCSDRTSQFSRPKRGVAATSASLRELGCSYHCDDERAIFRDTLR
jgi:CRISPR-associated endonuclease/helicase Cas3